MGRAVGTGHLLLIIVVWFRASMTSDFRKNTLLFLKIAVTRIVLIQRIFFYDIYHIFIYLKDKNSWGITRRLNVPSYIFAF